MKKRTGKMISLSLAVAMAVTAAPVTALADEPVKTDVIEAPALTSADQTEETTTEEGTAWAELTPAEKTEEEEVLSDEGTETTEGITTVEELNDEASAKENVFYVGETQGNGYTTLSDALTKAGTTESTIVLKNNVIGDFTIAENQNITLDLNGCKITNESDHTITNNGTLTIKDSSDEKTGTIDNVTHRKAAIQNEPNATIVLDGGTYTRSKESGQNSSDSGSNSYYNIVNHGKMTINDGTTVKQNGHFSSLIENGWYNGSDNSAETPSVMTINGGTFSGGLNTVKNDDYGKLTINGGDFSNVSQAVFLNWNVAEVNGGTFAVEDNAQSVILNGYLNGTMDQGQLTIHNGTFTANESGAFIKTMGRSKTTGEIEINGGNITGDIVLNDVTDGATVTVADGVTIKGNVQNDGLTDVTVTGATINGNLTNNSTGSISVTDTKVNGNVSNSQNGKMAIIRSDVDSYSNNITFIDSTQNGEKIPNTAEGSVAMTGATLYSSLGEAIEKVQADDIIYILKDVPDAAGITVASGKEFTVDFGGHTYTLKDPGAGSSGTETNGFQLLKDSTITFKNGTIRIAKETTSIKRIIQNYANLTLEDMHFYAENQADGQDYPLSFNNGSITFKGDTDIITPYDNNIAFDVCQFNNYPKVTVTFDESYTGTINGRIVYDSPDESTHKLYIKGNGTFGSIECTDKSNSAAKDGIKVTSGNFAESVNKDYLADEVKAQLKSHSNTKAPFSYYTSLKDALKAAKPGDKVTEVNTDQSKAQYTVTLKYNDGVTPDSAYTVSADTTITLPTPSRSHYSFEGWYNGNNLVESPYTVTENVELTAKWHRTSSGGGSSHRYDGYITVIDSKNGDVSVSDTWADEDDKITLTITPDKGYVVDKIEIVDLEGDKIDAKKVDDEDGKYTFRMANCDVTVTVTFKEEGKTTEDTDKEEDKDDEETTELNFTDVKESDWFFKGVEYVVDKGIMSGVSENEFAPSGKLTRAMLVQMLYNMESRPACDAENAFMDVPVGQWYTDAVIWANDAKIVSGMGEGLFAPNMEITREQMVAMLYNYAKYKGYDVTASADLSAFADTASVSAWAQPAMQWAVAEGYISGMGDSQLAPQGTATRAEIASVIMRFMEATAESAETAE